MAIPEVIIPYDPKFLGDGFTVPLPQLTPALKPSALFEGSVLDYTHFSLVMSTARKVALFTAANVDASRMVRVGRDVPWRMDERAGEFQLGPEVYANNQLDRGHLVRRQDVLWGSVNEAKLANSATFFYTNAAPQHQNFNQDEWLCLEDWVLERATDFSYRLCVFTGPVLRPDDLILSDLPPDLRTAFRAFGPAQIPAAFWKAIVLRDSTSGGDDLSVVCFAMRQSEMWNDKDGRRLLNLHVHQVTLQTIEKWTGLDFKELRNADELEWADERQRNRAMGREPEWPVVRSAEDIVYSGSTRRARGIRAPRTQDRVLRRASMELRAVEATSVTCGCTERFDAREAIAALGQEIARLTDVVADQNIAPQQPRAQGAGRSITGAAAGPDDVEERVDAIASRAPPALQGRVRTFAHNIITQADIARGRARIPAPSELKRIVGGDLVPKGGFPSCCCVGDASGWFCSGVLIKPNVVLTAAHCGATITRVMVGGNRVTPFMDAGAQVLPVIRTVTHPAYRDAPFHENDITVLILSQNAHVAPVPLATAEQLQADELELVGFGYNDPERPVGFGTKRQVRVPMGAIRLPSTTDDLSRLEDFLGFHADYEFVAGRKGLGRDTCNGDSGGPAYVTTSHGFAVAGLTSRATREAVVNCGDAGIYVRPDCFRDWLNETLTAFKLPPL